MNKQEKDIWVSLRWATILMGIVILIDSLPTYPVKFIALLFITMTYVAVKNYKNHE
jgi:hypothetical protein